MSWGIELQVTPMMYDLPEFTSWRPSVHWHRTPQNIHPNLRCEAGPHLSASWWWFHFEWHVL